MSLKVDQYDGYVVKLEVNQSLCWIVGLSMSGIAV